jgi:hypothetical protein
MPERHQAGALEAAQHRAAGVFGQPGLLRGFIGAQLLADAHLHEQLLESIERVIDGETRRFHDLRLKDSLPNGATDMPALAHGCARSGDANQDAACILYTPEAADRCAKLSI